MSEITRDELIKARRNLAQAIVKFRIAERLYQKGKVKSYVYSNAVENVCRKNATCRNIERYLLQLAQSN